MSTAIQFYRQSRSRTVEIEDVRIDGMLALEFVTSEIPIS
jgi:hypothetical protein